MAPNTLTFINQTPTVFPHFIKSKALPFQASSQQKHENALTTIFCAAQHIRRFQYDRAVRAMVADKLRRLEADKIATEVPLFPPAWVMPKQHTPVSYKQMLKNVEALPKVDDVNSIQLFAIKLGVPLPALNAEIRNTPSSKNSLRIFNALAAQNNGVIDANAARKGLHWYAEANQDAQNNPGKHPNVDLLRAVAEKDLLLVVMRDGKYMGTTVSNPATKTVPPALAAAPSAPVSQSGTSETIKAFAIKLGVPIPELNAEITSEKDIKIFKEIAAKNNGVINPDTAKMGCDIYGSDSTPGKALLEKIIEKKALLVINLDGKFMGTTSVPSSTTRSMAPPTPAPKAAPPPPAPEAIPAQVAVGANEIRVYAIKLGVPLPDLNVHIKSPEDVKIFKVLASKNNGVITPEAAKMGLEMYGQDAVQEAKKNPAKQPGLTLLQKIIEKGVLLVCQFGEAYMGTTPVTLSGDEQESFKQAQKAKGFFQKVVDFVTHIDDNIRSLHTIKAYGIKLGVPLPELNAELITNEDVRIFKKIADKNNGVINLETAKIGLELYGEDDLNHAKQYPEQHRGIMVLKKLIDKNALLICNYDGKYMGSSF